MPGDFSYRGPAASQAQYDLGVLLLEDCEGVNKWAASGTGTDFVNTFDASWCYFGSKGWKIRTRATTPAVGDVVTVQRVLAYPKEKRLVLRGRVNFSNPALIANLVCQFIIADGVRAWQASIQWTPQTPKVEYFSAAGAFVAMPTLAILISTDYWYGYEIHVDLIGMEFLNVVFAGVDVDLSGIGLNDGGASLAKAVVLGFTLATDGAASAEVGMDSIYCGAHEQI